MARRQKEIIMPHLNDCGGDLKKKWHVEYSIGNPQSGKMERIRTYDGIGMFICFTHYMAIRPGKELRPIRLNQIDYDARKIIIPNYISKNRDTEAVDIPDQLFELIIKKWKLHTYNQGLYVFGKNFEPSDKHLSVNIMNKRFNEFRNKLKLPDSIKLYSWKHSGVQEPAAQGASIYELQRRLRHRDLTTTEMYLKKRIG
jgi:integrase